MKDNMKFSYLLFLLILTASCNNQKRESKIYDFEGDLTKEQILTLDSLFNNHESKTTNQIALVTTADYGKDSSILFYAVNFFREHGIGRKDINNGVVIAFSATKRQVFIATGYGTEKVLKDEIAKKIIDSVMTPHFKEANLYQGLWNGSKAITNFLERPENKIK